MTTPTDPHSEPLVSLDTDPDASPGPAPRRWRGSLVAQSLLMLAAVLALVAAGGFGALTAECRDPGLAAGWTLLFAVIGVAAAGDNLIVAIPALAAWIGLVALVRRAVPLRISGRQYGVALVAIYVAAMAIGWLAIPADSCQLHF
ncbi:hypothetical protein [Burkholderia perseverans]|uniref:hypothetical protein n=1 Tax=Burkholderia perseverans TaxID=2615214 RepID=UPI001FEEA3FE|nr:hypothetical protein [Burkholderia perseverans]